ncbi:hypothetical protein ACFW04_014486 [Cataglyphis niger]
MNTLLKKVLKCVQHRHQSTHRPTILPISSATQMDTFVNYLSYIAGFNLKEVLNLCFKENIKDSLTPLFTWWGREKDDLYIMHVSLWLFMLYVLAKNRLGRSFNDSFKKLQTAEERLRYRMRDPLTRSNTRSINRERRINLWNDEEPEENAVEQGPTRNDED